MQNYRITCGTRLAVCVLRKRNCHFADRLAPGFYQCQRLIEFMDGPAMGHADLLVARTQIEFARGATRTLAAGKTALDGDTVAVTSI